ERRGGGSHAARAAPRACFRAGAARAAVRARADPRAGRAPRPCGPRGGLAHRDGARAVHGARWTRPKTGIAPRVSVTDTISRAIRVRLTVDGRNGATLPSMAGSGESLRSTCADRSLELPRTVVELNEAFLSDRVAQARGRVQIGDADWQRAEPALAEYARA